MTDAHRPRPARQEFESRVRLVAAGVDAIAERYATNLSEGGLFVRDPQPPPVGTVVLLEFVLPDGQPLSRVAARVVHARPATMADDPTAGMGLQFVALDSVAREIVERLDRDRPRAAPPTPREQDLLLDVVGLEAPLLTAGGRIVGIDLGTVNSCVAVMEPGGPRVISAVGGYDTIPSVVFVEEDGSAYVGHRAVERMILNPRRAIYGAKRFLGRPFASREVQMFGHFFTYQLVPTPDGGIAASLGNIELPLVKVSSKILRTLKGIAERYLGEAVCRAVVGVPAYFGETQREAVRQAGRLAGLHVERLVNEPTAAAIAYGYNRNVQRTVLVYDLGGGTFDATVLRIDGHRFEVLASDGDPFLGGADFDDRLTEYVLTAHERTGGPSLRGDPVAVQRIRFAVELAKRQLTEASVADLDLPYIAGTADGPVHLHQRLERTMLERLTEDLVDRTLAIVQQVLDRAGVRGAALDDVLLVGGQSRSPRIRERLFQRFAKRPSTALHPTEAVALGAAVVAEALHSDLRVHLADILPATIQLAEADGHTRPLLTRGTRLPAEIELEIGASQDARAEIRVVLFRGEGRTVSENTFLGALVFPPHASAALGGQHAKVRLQVSGDGLLSVQARHPVTGELRTLELLLTAS